MPHRDAMALVDEGAGAGRKPSRANSGIRRKRSLGDGAGAQAQFPANHALR